MTSLRILCLSLLLAVVSLTARADIVSSSESHFVLRHEATSSLTAPELWARLVKPASWWHPDHTYSGSAGNLSLDVTAGGLWREEWDTGSVTHGEVVYVQSGKVLRLNAPFGPLQSLGAYTIWTITIAATETGSSVTFDEVSNGPTTADMTEMAKAVDFVKGEAIRRLVDN